MVASGIDPANLVASAIVMVPIVAGFVLLFMRSYGRNRDLHGRARFHAAAIAFAAVWPWPVTLLYWWRGPTPERRDRRAIKS